MNTYIYTHMNTHIYNRIHTRATPFLILIWIESICHQTWRSVKKRNLGEKQTFPAGKLIMANNGLLFIFTFFNTIMNKKNS